MFAFVFATVGGFGHIGALFIAAVGAIVATVILSRLVRSKALGCLGGLVVGVLLLVGLIWLITTPKVSIDIPPAEGERLLKYAGLPEGSTEDFSYRFSAVGVVTTLADFKMREIDFLAWMKSQGWAPGKFQVDNEGRTIRWDTKGEWPDQIEAWPVSLYDSGGKVEPKQGYYVRVQGHPEKADNRIRIVYDLEQERVYFAHSTY